MFIGEFWQTFKNHIASFYNLFQKREAKIILSNLFYEENITLIPQADKDIIRKENHRPTL